jgi:hypothetical protein
MIKYIVISLIFLFVYYINYRSINARTDALYNQINYKTNSNLKYSPKGFIQGSQLLGGFNNQLEQLWFLNILAQRTGRVLAEKTLRPIDNLLGSRINMTELINRDKYLSNLATVPESEYLKHCGPYSFQVKLPRNKGQGFDELDYMIEKINSLSDKACISVGQFPSYDFFASGKFLNWVPTFKDLVLPNFEFSSLIQSQADYFAQQHDLTSSNYISVQFRRGDFEKHCKSVFSYGMTNWAFGMLLEDKYRFVKGNWDEFNDHCYPSTSRLVKKIINFNSNKKLPASKVLILTNAKNTEIKQLKIELQSKNLDLLRFTPNNKLIPSDVKWTITHSLAVEMELARRGKYLMGNRHSSINSNLIGMRLKKDLDDNILI